MTLGSPLSISGPTKPSALPARQEKGEAIGYISIPSPISKLSTWGSREQMEGPEMEGGPTGGPPWYRRGMWSSEKGSTGGRATGTSEIPANKDGNRKSEEEGGGKRREGGGGGMGADGGRRQEGGQLIEGGDRREGGRPDNLPNSVTCHGGGYESTVSWERKEKKGEERE